MTKKTLFTCVILCYLLISCEDNSIPEIPSDKITKKEFTYTGQSEIQDYNVYIGPLGNKTTPNIETANTIWGDNSLLGVPFYDKIIIDSKADSLTLKSANSSITVKLQIKQDTLKYHDGIEYLGIFKDDSTFIMNRAYYFINFKARNSYNSEGEITDTRGGHYGYWRVYEKAKLKEFFHENSSFYNLEDMTLKSDTIAYLTEYYEFRISKSNK